MNDAQALSDIQEVISALDVFSRAPNKELLERANSWLQDFQHSPKSWRTCNDLLRLQDTPIPAKLFAAQTFRAKVTYDLSQLSSTEVVALRDTLVAALETYKGGPRNIIIQISLAIAGLALQLPSWDNPVQSLIDLYGRNASTVPMLLEFLTLLPEEFVSNIKVPLTDYEFRERSAHVVSENAKRVVELLSMYITAAGITTPLQSQVFNCLYSWLLAGEISVGALTETPLFTYAFDALASDGTFDSGVDVICQMIHETQEIDDNMPAIELIVPRIVALKAQIAKEKEDPEKIRGYARIFSESGETYRALLLLHTETFFPLVEAIMECSAYPDLDIVPITFPFWMRLAQTLERRSSISVLFSDAYGTLLTIIIKHLHFPLDWSTLTGQEAENFRSFRHVMGDTLKDCCVVLKAETCLMAAYRMITNALSRGPDVSWQEIEAPLFAMRSMGAEIDPEDNDAVPKIMDLIPSLPNHPRVRYAALLIISRYTEWINVHPEYVTFQLQYISGGFDDPDPEVVAAAGQALKYMCQDCKQHLTGFLPTFHAFLTTTGIKLVQDDKRQVYEAIAYVISAMPMNRAAESLQTFSSDILTKVHTLSTKSLPPTNAEIEEVGDGLENLEVMLHVVQGYGEELPPACQNTCQEAWAIFDHFLSNYGLNYDLAERATRVIRRGIDLFHKTAFNVAPSVISRMSLAFEATAYPSFLWIAGKIVGRFGTVQPELKGASRDLFERSTNKVAALLHVKSPGEIPDVLEDYLQMLLQFVNIAPDILFASPSFSLCFRCVMTGLTVVHSDIIIAALDFFREVLTHDCLERPSATTPAEFSVYGTTIRDALNKEGLQFIDFILKGLLTDFPEDSTAVVVSIFRSLVDNWSNQLLTWIPTVLKNVPLPDASKTQFIQEITIAANTKQYDKVKYAVLALDRASKKTRERRRMVM